MLHQLIVDSPELKRVVNLEKLSYSIGRDIDNSIVIPSLKLSRRHANLVKKTIDQQDFYCIFDGDEKGNRSMNGIWINGHRCLQYELKHGDIIYLCDEVKLSYQIIQSPVNFSDQVQEEDALTESAIFKANLEKSKSTSVIFDFDFTEHFYHKQENASLFSLVELSPHPLIEIDFFGKITYLNSAAIKRFKNIQKLQLKHPLIQNIIDLPFHQNGNLIMREVVLDESYFEQHIHYLIERQSICIYIFDITQRKKAEKNLKKKAFSDPLTGLPNRNFFSEKLSRSLVKNQTHKDQIAIMFLDLDNFKNINDTLGHNFGDELLRNFGKRLKSNLREGDLIARWGGDEFTILLHHTKNLAQVKEVAQRFLDILKQPFHIEGHQLHVKSSIGIAVYPQDGEDAATLLKNADAALYKAKEWGRNSYQFYSSAITSISSERLKMENLLHQALEKEEFILHYQPQLNLNTGKIYGMEALVRWQHSEMGLIFPQEFIPLAEQTGLITSIGEWVLRRSCQQNRDWQKAGLSPFKIGVNLAVQQIQQPNFTEILRNILQETELDPCWLELEITETSLMQNVNQVRRTIDQIQQMGVDISIDDFGTGYSSLGYLKQFPFQTIKIDRAFVKDLKKDNAKDLAIISAVISLGRGFNLRVIAEGVETQEQLELLKRMQCELIQGYCFSQPLPEEKVIKFITLQEETGKVLYNFE